MSDTNHTLVPFVFATAIVALIAGGVYLTGTGESTTETTPTVVCDAFTVNDSVELMCFAQGNVSVEFSLNQSNVHGTLWTGETHG